MDLSKLSPAEKIIAGSAAALLVISFLPWFGLGGSGGVDAWDNLLSAFAVLIGIVMALQILLSNFSTAKLPKPPVPWGRVHLILGAVALALVLLLFVVGDELSVSALGASVSVELERKIGLFLGLAAAGGLAYGGFRRSKEPEISPGYMP